ncbi:hypothetical protein [Paenibacillus spongiae]|uniref:ABC transporter permease n=1 Tax=Paenibacillus spongiae TaxID=2909671 RepID=A0ABY5SBS8_9BACL|nr:hypothetical protein [Paenibacillus spongiae]UVI30980.1 hypothetical protein L1F29_03700 [Paenibacillus spongiae]
MSGFSIRLRLWLKLWFTSLPAIILMLLLPAAAYVIYVTLSYRPASFTSMFYEQAAMLVYVFILQWCFSIDFDSKFAGQLITYPIARWKLIAERVLLASLLFTGLLCLVTTGLTPFAGSLVWKALLFSIPVYMGAGGIVVLAVVIGRHSLGGLFAGLVVWIISLNHAASLQVYRPNLLELPGVHEYLNGNLLAGSPDLWILYNRLCYIGLGLLLIVLAILHFNRKSV